MPSAGAATFYVDDDAPAGSTTCTQALPCDTIGEADVASAATAPGPHTISVAAGLYQEAVVFGGPNQDGLELLGAGTGTDLATSTIIRSNSGQALALGDITDPPEVGMALRHLRVEANGNVVNAAGSEIEDVAFVSTDPTSTGTMLSLRAPDQLVERVVLRGGPQSRGIYMQESSASTSDTDWTLRDLDVIAGRRGGIQSNTDSTGRLLLQRARVSAPATANTEASLRSQGPMRVESSLVTGGAASAIVAFASAADPTVLRNVTADAGQPGIVDPQVDTGEGPQPNSVSGQGGQVQVGSSILLEPAASSGGTVRCENSNVTGQQGPGSQCPAGAQGNLSSTPAQLFTGPGTDWHLRAGSPAIDTGRAGGLLTGESPFDLARLSRVVDGNRDGVARLDQGAYEARTPPPPTTSVLADTLRPAVTSARFRPRRFRPSRRSTRLVSGRKRAPLGSRLRFRLSEASDVRIRIERALKGRRSKGKCRRATAKLRSKRRCTRWKKVVSLRRNNLAAGNIAVRFTGRIRRKALPRGPYRVVVVATDDAGNRSTLKHAGFRIVR